MVRGTFHVLAGFLWLTAAHVCCGQHLNAHAHNDYEHARPLFDALQNGFLSVEADVHLLDGVLKVGHNRATRESPTLEALYLAPLDSLIRVNGSVYASAKRTFYLMIDVKTDGEAAYLALLGLMASHPAMNCASPDCPVKVFLSGNRPIARMMKDGYKGLAIDGRPDDIGKGYTVEWMPVISDNYRNWSSWNGDGKPSAAALKKVRDLADRVHAEGKKLRLWAIPDNEIAWRALLEAGVDLINSDRLPQLNEFLTGVAK